MAYVRITRRDFLRSLAAGAGGAVLGQTLLGKGMRRAMAKDVKSPVVVVKDPTATDYPAINEPVVQAMMDAGVKALTRIDDLGEAWKSCFPGIDRNKVISVKVNCINSSLSSHPEVANTIVNGLTQMDFGGNPFPENNIIIWDRSDWELTNAGYTINDGSTGVRYFGTNHSGVGYDMDEDMDIGGGISRPSRIITHLSDYTMNLAVMKDHGTSGVTFCMKNHYGSVSPVPSHNTRCNPYIAILNQLIRDQLGKREGIFIIDGLFGIYSGGPSGSPQIIWDGFIVSKDPVACDFEGRWTIDFERYKRGLNPTDAPHIETARELGVGTFDEKRGDVRLIQNPGLKMGGLLPGDPVLGLYGSKPNPARYHSRISFSLREPGTVDLSVFDLSGSRVVTLKKGKIDDGAYSVDWDLRDEKGHRIPAGSYFFRFALNGKYTRSEKMVVMK
jgi:hypothetical protein